MSKTLYCCGVDFQHEIGEASDLEGSMPLYSSVKELKEKPRNQQKAAPQNPWKTKLALPPSLK